MRAETPNNENDVWKMWRENKRDEKTRNYALYTEIDGMLPSTQSCVRISNNLDMMHNSYELSTGWRQKNFRIHLYYGLLVRNK